MFDLAAWQAAGQLVTVTVATGTHEVFVHVSGQGEWVTMLHGFPTSSLEWAEVLPAVEAGHRVLASDFPGFGLSDKPNLDYTIAAQADIIQALWKEFGISQTAVVGYDYGGMVVMELLARARGGQLATTIENVVLLNSAIFADTYRPRLLTRWMASGPLAPLLGPAMNEKNVTRSWSAVFSPDHPLDPALARQFWELLQRDAHRRPLPRLLHFVPERKANAARWDDALTNAAVPLHLIWGTEDLVSGGDAHLVPHRLPHAGIVTLAGVGHSPHLEASETTGRHLQEALGIA